MPHAHTTSPGQTTVLTEQGLPTGAVVGFQILKAATGTVAIARTTTGVIERPTGSGNYVLNFIAPVDGDLYLVVSDWSGGVLAPETSRVSELIVMSWRVLANGAMLEVATGTHIAGEREIEVTTTAIYRAGQVIKGELARSFVERYDANEDFARSIVERVEVTTDDDGEQVVTAVGAPHVPAASGSSNKAEKALRAQVAKLEAELAEAQAPQVLDYSRLSASAVAAEVAERELEVAGTGKDGNVLKDDNINALIKDDASKS